jgi:cytochrome c oxidase subunit 4
MEHTTEQSHAADHDTAHHVNKHVKGYLMVGGLLLFFTALTVWLSFWDFGTIKANIVVAMILATVKASLVALIFMHLKSEKWTIYRFLVITIVFFIGLFALTGLALFDPIRLN